MDARDSELQDKALEAAKKGDVAGVLALVSEMGAAVETAPEAGVKLRMRAGSGTDDGCVTTGYEASAERPAGWPADVPFLANTQASLTLFDKPGRRVAVQWWKVEDPARAAQAVVQESLAAGWQETSAPSLPGVLAGLRIALLERDGVERTVLSAAIKDFGLVSLTEGRKREG